jgi:hypothetical protein
MMDQQPRRVFALLESLESRTLMSGVSGVHDGLTLSEPNSNVNAPARPSNLAGTVGAGGVTMSWTDNSDNETGFAVFRYHNASITQVGTVDANVTTFTDTTPPTGMDYYIVRAINADGRSEGSNPISVKVDPVVAMRAPRRMRSEAVSTTSIKLSWQDDTGGTNGYVIERYGDNGWTTVGTTAVGVRKFTDTGLTSHTKYYYRVTVLGPNGQSAVSNVLIGMTKKTDKGEPGKK